jgi:hypothetical protein
MRHQKATDNDIDLSRPVKLVALLFIPTLASRMALKIVSPSAVEMINKTFIFPSCYKF